MKLTDLALHTDLGHSSRTSTCLTQEHRSGGSHNPNFVLADDSCLWGLVGLERKGTMVSLCRYCTVKSPVGRRSKGGRAIVGDLVIVGIVRCWLDTVDEMRKNAVSIIRKKDVGVCL